MSSCARNRTSSLIFLLSGLTIGAASADDVAWDTTRDGTPASEQNATVSGYVFAFGHSIESPWEFTGAGADTLYLNGVPYAAINREEPNIAVSALGQTKYELHTTAQEAIRAGATYDERLQILSEVYRSSSLVKDVRCFANGVWVYFNGGTEEEILLPVDGPGLFDLLTYHHQLMEEFWKTVGKGGLIAVGHGYHITCPKRFVRRTLELIERIDQGEQLTAEDRKNTALQNLGFLSDISPQGSGQEKER